MADGDAAIRLAASDQLDPSARSPTMHPFGLYVAAVDAERDHSANAQRNRQQQYAAVDALPLTEPAQPSRVSRLTGILRRRVARSAGA